MSTGQQNQELSSQFHKERKISSFEERIAFDIAGLRGELSKIEMELKKYGTVIVINGEGKPWVRNLNDFHQDIYDVMKAFKKQQEKKKEEEMEKEKNAKKFSLIKDKTQLFYFIIMVILILWDKIFK